MIIFHRDHRRLNIRVVEILRHLEPTAKHYRGREYLRKELSVTTGISLKPSFNAFFESIIFCKTINVGPVIFVAITLQFVSTENEGQIRK